MLPAEKAYGFVAVYRKDNTDKFLLVCQKSGWSFPKGHIEEGELPLEVAERELKEETGVSGAIVIPGHTFTEEYTFVRKDVPTHKLNIYFLATLPRVENIRPQEGEILECKLATYEEAMQLFKSENRKRILTDARTALQKIPRS